MQKVNVPGVGVIQFPDDMTPQQIQIAIERDVLPKVKKAEGPRGPNGELLDPMDPAQYPEATFAENLAAGGGKFLNDAWLGIKQRLGQATETEVDEVKKRDQALLDAPGGKVGNIAGGAIAGLPLAAIPGVNTLPGAAVVGGLMGLIEPTGKGDSVSKNVGTGAMFSAGAQALGSALPAAKAAFFDPWFKRGQERIVGDLLKRSTNQPAQAASRMANPDEFVAGVKPSAAEASEDAGIAGLQLASAAADPRTKEMLTRQAIENNAARIRALRDVAKDEPAVTAAKAARESASKPGYDAAKAQMLKADDELKALMSRPSMKSAWQRAQALAKERGETLVVGKDMPAGVIDTGLLDASGKAITKEVAAESAEYSGKGLHYLKMALDDAVDTAPASGIGKNERAAILETKKKLVEWFDRSSPDYKAARETYRAKSQPINEMQYTQELERKLLPALMEGASDPTRLRPEAFAAALRDADNAIKHATGKDLPIDEVLSPAARKKVFGVRDDLARKARAEDMAKTTGSTTAQNLATKNLLRQAGGPMGMPESWAESTLLTSLFRPVGFVAKGADARIQERLAEALSNPKYAAQLMTAAQSDPMLAKLAMALRDYLPISAASAALNSPQ